MKLAWLVGAAFGLALLAFSFGAGAGGHGTFIPVFLSSSPVGPLLLLAGEVLAASSIGGVLTFGAIPFLWAVLFGMAANGGKPKGGRRFRIAMGLHYLVGITIILLPPIGDWGFFFSREWAPSEIRFLLGGAAVYCACQVSVWLIFRNARARRDS